MPVNGGHEVLLMLEDRYLPTSLHLKGYSEVALPDAMDEPALIPAGMYSHMNNLNLIHIYFPKSPCCSGITGIVCSMKIVLVLAHIH